MNNLRLKRLFILKQYIWECKNNYFLNFIWLVVIKNKCTIVFRNYNTHTFWYFYMNIKYIILCTDINIDLWSLGKNVLHHLVNSYRRNCLVPYNHLNRILQVPVYHLLVYTCILLLKATRNRQLLWMSLIPLKIWSYYNITIQNILIIITS